MPVAREVVISHGGPDAIEQARQCYSTWYSGLCRVALLCRSLDLRARIMRPSCPMEPWRGVRAVDRRDNSVLDANDLIAFKEMAAAGAKPRALAHRFGMTPRQARNLKFRMVDKKA